MPPIAGVVGGARIATNLNTPDVSYWDGPTTALVHEATPVMGRHPKPFTKPTLVTFCNILEIFRRNWSGILDL